MSKRNFYLETEGVLTQFTSYYHSYSYYYEASKHTP